MSTTTRTKIGEKEYDLRSISTRKIKRQIMKTRQGNNRIRKAWHEQK